MTRNCVACGQVDDHPRHILINSDYEDVPFHLDCHSRMGCSVCSAQLEGADGLTGDALRAHLTADLGN